MLVTSALEPSANDEEGGAAEAPPLIAFAFAETQPWRRRVDPGSLAQGIRRRRCRCRCRCRLQSMPIRVYAQPSSTPGLTPLLPLIYNELKAFPNVPMSQSTRFYTLHCCQLISILPKNRRCPRIPADYLKMDIYYGSGSSLLNFIYQLVLSFSKHRTPRIQDTNNAIVMYLVMY